MAFLQVIVFYEEGFMPRADLLSSSNSIVYLLWIIKNLTLWLSNFDPNIMECA